MRLRLEQKFYVPLVSKHNKVSQNLSFNQIHNLVFQKRRGYKISQRSYHSTIIQRTTFELIKYYIFQVSFSRFSTSMCRSRHRTCPQSNSLVKMRCDICPKNQVGTNFMEDHLKNMHTDSEHTTFRSQLEFRMSSYSSSCFEILELKIRAIHSYILK